MTDDEIRALWRAVGGKFHGPSIETGTMPESLLLPFLRGLFERAAPPAQPAIDDIDRLRGLLTECEATLAMWTDVAPAVSLRADIRKTLGLP